jgi:hypothetical protein
MDREQLAGFILLFPWLILVVAVVFSLFSLCVWGALVMLKLFGMI